MLLARADSALLSDSLSLDSELLALLLLVLDGTRADSDLDLDFDVPLLVVNFLLSARAGDL